MTTSKRELKQDYNGMEGAVTSIGLDSYATAWRYLGTYTDCSSGSSSSWKWWGWNKQNNADNSTSSSATTCSGGTRKLLWAAYKNPSYSGSQIGEYEFYVDGEWDDSTCTGDSCTPMDCHDPWSHNWQLLGIYKETVDFGNDMFYEQLFKHQGYCLWDGDKEDNGDDGENGSGSRDSNDYSDWGESTYQFMQAMRNELPSGCTAVGDFTYGSESNYYINIKPLPEGDVTLGVYTDSSCLIESGFTFEDYQNAYASSLTSTGSSGAFDTWNANMDAYKVCQPCRAYNREQMYQRRSRGLAEYYDGQGDYEMSNYNCYDDAHYQNCNQCYKFETHTDMEKATTYDLQAASSEGTILLINYKDTWYGSGTVGDAAEPVDTNSTAYTTGYSEGWAAAVAAIESGDYVVSYSAASGAAFLLCGFALVKTFRKITSRRIVLASEEGSAMPSPLV